MRQKLKLFLFLFVLTQHSALCQKLMEISDLHQSPMIDGNITDDEWQVEDSVVDFVQIEPQKGLPSTRQTIVYSGQFKGNLYFAFKCFVNDPGEISARIQRRDQLDNSDDIIAILLDTYNDKRTSLLFFINPLGTLADAKVTDDGKNMDFNWDMEWEAKVQQTSYGWSVEIALPYSSMQFAPKIADWGVNFGRVIRANQETSWWSEVTENFRVSQGGILKGIDPKGNKKNGLKLFPYATLRYEDSDITGEYNKIKPDAGVDLTYNIGSNLIANLTYNPDFATVEGDKEQINLTPWEIRFPDKRLFFQDGNEMFSTRINNFYSRRIGDTQYGGKFIGKAGKYQFNGLFAKTEENRDQTNPEAWFNALRFRRDILGSSSIGLTYADKIWDEKYVRSLSIDYNLNLGKTWKFNGQLVGSAPGDFASHSAWFVRFAKENNIYHYHIRFSSFGKNFQENVNETGFIQDDDRQELDGDVNYRWWINKGFKYIEVAGSNNVFWSQENVLRSWYLTYRARAYSKQKISLDLYYNNEYKLLDKEYFNHFYKATLGYNTDESAFVEAGYTTGRNFDRDFKLIQARAKALFFKKFNINYELNIIKYNPDEDHIGTTINVIGADYFFNKDLWIRIFTQNNSSINKYYFYGVFGWRFKPPFGAVYLIVSSDHFDEYNIGQPEITEINSNIIFLKATYPLVVF